jgi:hypothetical protein
MRSTSHSAKLTLVNVNSRWELIGGQTCIPNRGSCVFTHTEYDRLNLEKLCPR